MLDGRVDRFQVGTATGPGHSQGLASQADNHPQLLVGASVPLELDRLAHSQPTTSCREATRAANSTVTLAVLASTVTATAKPSNRCARPLRET